MASRKRALHQIEVHKWPLKQPRRLERFVPVRDVFGYQPSFPSRLLNLWSTSICGIWTVQNTFWNGLKRQRPVQNILPIQNSNCPLRPPEWKEKRLTIRKRQLNNNNQLNVVEEHITLWISTFCTVPSQKWPRDIAIAFLLFFKQYFVLLGNYWCPPSRSVLVNREPQFLVIEANSQWSTLPLLHWKAGMKDFRLQFSLTASIVFHLQFCKVHF